MSQRVGNSPLANQGNVRLTAGLLVTLAVLSAAAPLATDMYLPAFPQMVADLHTTATGVQLSLTSFLVGAGLGQVLFGPLSDRLGRVRPLLIGTLIYVVASAFAAVAPSIELLVMARLIQGLSGAAGMVIGRAIISDLARGKDAARAFSILMLVGGVAPVAAPFLGSLLSERLGWRGVLWVVAAVGAIALAASLVFIRETRPIEARVPDRTGGSLAALCTRRFIGNALAYAFAFATLMAYISASPFLYQSMMGLNNLQYGLLFGTNALTLTVVGGLSARWTRTVSPVRLARVGLAINLTGVAVIGVLVVAGAPIMSLAVAIPLAMGALGLVFGNVTALALDQARKAPGLGSAVLGLLQFVLAGATAPLVSIGGQSTAVPFIVTVLVCSVIANGAFTLAGHHTPSPANEAPDGASA